MSQVTVRDSTPLQASRQTVVKVPDDEDERVPDEDSDESVEPDNPPHGTDDIIHTQWGIDQEIGWDHSFPLINRCC